VKRGYDKKNVGKLEGWGGNWEEFLVYGAVIAWIFNTEGMNWIYTDREGSNADSSDLSYLTTYSLHVAESFLRS
jgi:hypothetical protein